VKNTRGRKSRDSVPLISARLVITLAIL
jgi:hypothetical protein